MNLLFRLILLCLFVGVVGAHAAGTDPTCLGRRYLALKSGGFTGPLLCDSHTATFRLVGRISTANAGYLFYDYRYRFKPSEGSVLHGGQRLLVFDTHGEYIGQYALTPPPYFKVAIKKGGVVVSSNGERKGGIDFREGPPSEVYVNGDRAIFFK